MADDHEEFQLLDSSFDNQSPHLLPTSSAPIHPPPAIAFPPPKIESSDDAPFTLLGGDDAAQSSAPNRNFRSKKRNRVMQSCVACHAQKRKCDRKRPCTRCTEHGIAGQCVYQLEDPAVREGPEQDELYRLRGRVRELEHTVRVLMQKPLSRRAAAALEAETDAILGTTSTRKRKVEKDKLDGSDDKNKKLKCHTHSDSFDNNALPEWLPMPDPSFPSPAADSPFSPFAPTPSDTHFPHSYYHHFNDFTPPGDVPTPPYSTFPTPSSDAGSPFKVPEPPARRFSDGASLANMLSQATMAATPESLVASSPASVSVAGGVTFAPIQGAAPPGECGCGVNPIGNEVLSELQAQLEAAHGVIASLPDHQVGGACVTVLGIASLIDAIATATRSNNSQALSAPPVPQQQPPPGPQPMPVTAPTTGPPPAPASTPSYLPAGPASHMTPISTTHGMSPMSHLSPSEPGPSPHSSIATPPNYGLYPAHQASSYYGDVPVVGFTSLSSWAAYGAGPAAHQPPFMNHRNNSTSSLSNYDGSKDHQQMQQHHQVAVHTPSHSVGHHHHHHGGIMVTYDHAHP